MNKSQLIELVKEKLSGGDAPPAIRGKYHPKVISKFLEMAYDDLVSLLQKEGTQTNDYSALDNFGKSYILPILKDELRNEYYVELPIKVVPIPDNQGIRLVSPKFDQSAAYDYIDNNSNHIWNKLFNGIVRPVGKYYVETPRVYLQPVNTPEPNSEMLIKAIPPFSNLLPEDDVFIPGGKNTVLFEMVYGVMRKNQTPKQDYNNESSKQI